MGGIDTQYPRGQYYPGAFQFALELSRFGVPADRDPARVAVLTARAREFKVRSGLFSLFSIGSRKARCVGKFMYAHSHPSRHYHAFLHTHTQFALELKPSHKVCVKFAKAGVDGGVEGWGVGRVLYGSVKEW